MGFWDDVVNAGEDLLEGGQRLLGEAVDGVTDAAGDVLDAVGADGLADDVRDWGDSIADQLGATPAEAELGESDDPRDLVHGDPGKMRDRAGKLDGLAADFTAAGEGLRGISVGEFTGEAADAYHQAVNEEYPKWTAAGDAATSASQALTALADAVQHAQERAAEAIRLWKEAERLGAEWDQMRADYEAAVASNADTLPPHPGDDPEPGLKNEAVQVLNDAREHRNSAATTAAAAFNDAANEAPPEPPASERLMSNLGDLYQTGGMFTSHMGVGLVGAVTDMGRLVRMVNPTDPYNIAHPADYATNATSVAAGLTNMAAHPDELIKGIIGTGWSEDPGQATGVLLSNFIPMGPKGTGAFRSLLSDAGTSATRELGEAGARSGLPDAPNVSGHADAPSAGHSPSNASTSVDAATPDGAPAARTGDSAVDTPDGQSPVRDGAPAEAPTPDRSPDPVPENRTEPTAAEPNPTPEPARSPEPERAPEPDRSPDEMRDPPQQATPEPRSDPQVHDRTPDQSHSDRADSHSDRSDSPRERDGSDAPRESGRTPEGDRTPDGDGTSEGDRTPEAGRTPEGDRTPDTDQHPRGDKDPTTRSDTDPDMRAQPDPHGRAGEQTPGQTEAARAADPEAPPRAGDNGAPPANGVIDSPNTAAATPNSTSPAQPAAPNPTRLDQSAGPSPTRDLSPQPGRDAPAPRSEGPPRADTAPRAEVPAGKGAANAADDAVRPTAARTANDSAAPANRSPIEPAAVVDSRPHPGGDKTVPAKPDAPGNHERGNRDPDGQRADDVDDGEPPANNEALADDAASPGASEPPREVQCTGTEPVNIATGEYFLPATDVDLPAVLGLQLTRTHKSNYRAGVWMGRSWSCTFDSRVVITTDAVTTVDGDGVLLSFDHPTGDEPSVARRGRPWKLWAAQGGGYRLSPPSGEVTYHFAPKPHLGGTDVAEGVIFISAITDRFHNRILFTYTDSGAPSGVVHSAGYRIGVDCDGYRIRGYTLATDAGSTVLRRFGYTRGDLTSVTDGDGATTRFAYDEAHRMVGWTDSTGASYENRYDSAGRVTYQGGADGVWASTFEYRDDPTGGGRTTLHTDALGETRVYGFDADLRPRAVADAMGRVTRSDFNVDRNPLRVTDALGATTEWVYTPEGLPAQITDPLSGSTVLSYVETTAGWRPAQVTTPDGAVTSFGYDDSGNRVTLRDPAGGVWRWEYDAAGAVSARIDPLGRRTSYLCNAAGLPVRITDPAGSETTCSYDAFGNLVEMVGPDGATTRIAYDLAGRPVSRTGPDGATESWTYDGEGNRLSHTGPTGATTYWEYGFYDLPVTQIDPNGGRTRFGYDKARRLTSVTNPAGLSWDYRYYPDGRLAAQSDFNGATTTYTYDGAGRLASRTNAAGQTISYTYDAAGRMTGESSSGGDFAGEQITYRHDAAGRVVAVEMPWADAVIAYDAAGRVVSETVAGRAVHTVVNAAGEPVEVLTPSGLRTSVSYDRRGIVDTVSVGGRRCELTTDVIGRQTRMQFGTSAIDSAFDDAGRLASRRVVAGVRDLSVLNLGVGGAARERVLAAAGYGYRADDSLTEVIAADPSAPVLGTAAAYGTDVMGRLTSRRTAAGLESTVFDAAMNPTVREPDSTAASAGWTFDGVRLIDDGRSRYHYDPAGRLQRVVTKRLGRKPDVWTYRWDGWDRLREVTTPDGRVFSYTYDPAGRRLSKTADDGSVVWFSWSGDQLVEQASTSGGEHAGEEVVSWSYLPGRHTPFTQTHSAGVGSGVRPGELTLDGPVATASQVEVDRRFYAIVADHIDTPVALLDPSSGELVGRAHATMWGDTAWSGEVDTPWRYPGQYHDPETGLHYNRHRYYQPGTGRYLTPDPLGLAPAPNPYNYPGNPTAWADPLGLAPCTGTVWDNITPTQGNYPATPIPRSFSLATEHGDFWVHPNATKHILERWSHYLDRGLSLEAARLNVQSLLSSLHSAVTAAAGRTFEFDNLFNIDGWELKLGPAKPGGSSPELFHAVPEKDSGFA